MYILQPHQYRSTIIVLFSSFQCVISRTEQMVCMVGSQKSSVRPSIKVYMGTPHFAVYTGKNCMLPRLIDNWRQQRFKNANNNAFEVNAYNEIYDKNNYMFLQNVCRCVFVLCSIFFVFHSPCQLEQFFRDLRWQLIS